MKYQAYFHDGALVDIKHVGNTVEILMSSAEMNPEDMRDNIQLAADDSIKWKLHIEGITSINIRNQESIEILYKTYDSGTILDFEIDNGIVELGILWSNYRPKPPTNDFSIIKIKGNKIWWENIPDLKEPYQ